MIYLTIGMVCTLWISFAVGMYYVYEAIKKFHD